MMRDLKADLELCQRATPGPWRDFDDTFEPAVYTKEEDGCRGLCIARMFGLYSEVTRNNARFIAAAREGWPEAIRRAIATEQRVRELEERLAGDELETLDFLWQEYVQADPATLTEDAKELAAKVRQKVRELAGVQRLETALAEAERMRPFLECLYAQRVHEDGWCEECETFNGHAPGCVMAGVEVVLGAKAPEVQCMGCCGECEIRKAQERAVKGTRRADDAPIR